VQQVIAVLVYTPGRAHAVVTQLRCLVGGVPALHGLDKTFRAVARLVIPEPGCPDDGSAKRRRVLLVLRGEVVLADRFSDMSQGRFGFALRMENVADCALEQASPERTDDVVHLFGFSDRGKHQYVPAFLLQDMTDQVVLMQPLHNDDDAAPRLVIEPAEERVVVPFIDRVTAR